MTNDSNHLFTFDLPKTEEGTPRHKQMEEKERIDV